jgi:hypothetical protein
MPTPLSGAEQTGRDHGVEQENAVMTQRDQLTNDQSQINDAVDSAAIPISIEIDRMLSGLPADADLDEIASSLIAIWLR